MRLPHLRTTQVLLFALIGVSLVVRWTLVLHGGQFFFPDEGRYEVSRLAAHYLWGGHLKDALRALSSADHLGFKAIGVLPALVEMGLGENPSIPALFFSLFNVAIIPLVWLLARRLGADEEEALWAAFLVATSNSLLLLSPHLLPYSTGMVLGLLALFVGLSPKESWSVSVLTGLWASLTFITYNGYWSIAAFAVLAHIFQLAGSRSRLLMRPLLALAGALLPFLLMVVACVVLHKKIGSILVAYQNFSGSVTQGLYTEGATLPFSYFWAADGIVSVLWVPLVASSVGLLRGTHRRRLLIGLGGIVFVYVCLVVMSVFLHKLVVYGRLVKQIVPFVALLGASTMKTGISRLRWPRWGSTTAVTVLVVLAALNFSPLFRLNFPKDFVREAQTRHPDFHMPEESMSYKSPDVVEVGHFRAHYLKYIHPYPKRTGPVQGTVLMKAQHPQAYWPFMYEGYTPTERARFRETDFSMVLEDTGQ